MTQRKVIEVKGINKSFSLGKRENKVLKDLSVIENVALPAQLLGMNKSDALNRAEKVLQDVGMLKFRDFYTSELSSGEQQKVGLARALITDPEIVVADEPTGNLDPETSGQILQLLHDICKKETTVVMTTHNYTLVRNYPARIVKCENGFLSDLDNEKEGE